MDKIRREGRGGDGGEQLEEDGAVGGDRAWERRMTGWREGRVEGRESRRTE